MRTGNQEPTFQCIGEYSYSYGQKVAEMFKEDGGATFMPAQEKELELMLARNKDGSPAAMTFGIAKARQNGKSYAARYYATYMSDFEHRAVLYSAHHSSTTAKMFKALCDLFESPELYPEFAEDVKFISHARGYEGIYFKSWKDDDGKVHPGGCIEFATRTNSGSRGGTYSVIIFDEAQELTSEQQEAMLPTISASADANRAELMPQQIFIGTPPAPTCKGDVFREMHDSAHGDTGKGAWWLEWSVNELKQLTRDEALEQAYRTNPAMGYRIAEKTVLNEFETMRLDGFFRERLGWWSPVVEHKEVKAIDEEAWDACASDELKPEGKTAYGIKFSADGSEVCLCGAVKPVTGKSRISLIDIKPTGLGIRWLADFLNARYGKAACVVIDGRNGVDVLIDRIQDTWRMKGSIIRPSAKDMLAAVGTMTNAIDERSLTWYRQQETLRESAVTSVRRDLGGGWAFGGENSLPIEAAALALWGVETSKRDPSKKMRIG